MNSHNMLRTILMGTASLAIFGFQGTSSFAAETAENIDIFGLEEIVVTARRRDETLYRVPATVTALGSDQLRAQSINSEADLQRAVPGLLIRESLSSNQLNYSIRGQSVDAFSSSSPGVLGYINEFQVTATSASSLYDLDLVQVIKGPQGTLYGRNTTGGAVLFTTARPTDDLSASAQIGIGNFDLRKAEGSVSVPLIEGKLAVRLAGKIVRRDGYQFNDFRNEDLGRVSTQSGRISILMRPSEGLESLTMAQYDANNGNNIGSPIQNVYPCGAPNLATDTACTYTPAAPFWGPYIAGNPGAFPGGLEAFTALQQARGPYKVSLNSDFEHRGRQKMVINNTTYEVSSNVTLKNVIGYAESSSHDSTDVDGTPYAIYANGLWDEDDLTEFGNRQFSEEFQIQGTAFDEQLTYLVGGYYGYERKTFYIPTRFFDLRPVVPDVPLADKDNVQVSRNQGIFAHGSYDLGPSAGLDGLTLTAGLRYTWEQVKARHLPRSLFYQLGIAPDGVSSSFENPSWNVGLEYQATPDLLLYITQRGSWRSGGFNTNSQLFDGNIDVGGAEFDPETTKDIEIGLKYSGLMADVPVQISIAAFNQWVDDIQRVVYVSLPLFGPTALTANIPQAEISGFEIAGQIKPVQWLSLGGNVVYNDARFTKSSVTLFGVETDFGPYPDQPKWAGSAFAMVTVPLEEEMGELVFRGDLYAQSKFYYSSLNDTINPQSDLPGYSLVNFRLDWNEIAGSSVSASAFVTNAFDKTYYTGGLALGSVLGLNASIPGPSRMYGAELRVSF